MLIDAFTYFNEKELVELRLKYLDPIVDYFVGIGLSKQENTNLLDSITFLIQEQENFKLEYLKILDEMMEKKDTNNEIKVI